MCTYEYVYLWRPGIEVAEETVKLPPYVSAVLCFALARFGATEETVTFRVTQVWQTVLLPGIEVAEKTVFASRNMSALLCFAPHPCRERMYPFRM